MNKLNFILTRIALLLLLLNIANITIYAGVDQKKVDSLKNVIANTQDSKEKVNGKIALAKEYLATDKEKVFEYLNQAIDISKEANRPDLLFSSYNNIGLAYHNVSEYDKAIKYFQKALSYKNKLRSDEQRKMIGSTYNNLGRAYSSKDDKDSSLYFYKKSIKSKEQTGQYLSMAKTLSNIGVLYFRLDNYQKAYEYFIESLKMKKKHGADPRSLSKTLTNIGNVFLRTEKHNKAIEYYNRSADIKKQYGDRPGISTVYSNIANILMFNNKLDSSLIYYNKSLKIKKQIGDKRGIAGIYNNIATVYRKKSDLSKSEEYNLKALNIRQEIGNKRGIAASKTNLGSIYLEQGKYNESFKNLEEARKIAEENSYDRVLEEVYYNLTAYYEARNNPQKALGFHKKYHSIREKLLDLDANARIAKLEQKYNKKQKEEIIKRQNAEKKLMLQEKQADKKTKLFLYFLIGLMLIILALVIIQLHSKRRYNKKLKMLNSDLDRRVKSRTWDLQKENDVRQQTEQELRESEQRYRTVMETVNAGIAISDVNEHIIFMNEAFSRMLKYKQEELLDQSLEMIVNTETFARFKQETQSRKKGVSNQYLVKLHCKDGQELDAILSASPLFNDNGQYIGGVASITNITELKNAEASLTEALRKSEKINNTKNQVLNSINEELRSPLQNILGMSELLESTDGKSLTEEQRKLINNILKSAENLKLELLNIASLAEINAQDINTKSELINLKDAYNEAIKPLSNLEKPVINNIESIEEAYISGDIESIHNALGGLIEHALLMSNEKAQVNFFRDKVKFFINIEIIHDGNKLEKEEIENILDPFQETNRNIILENNQVYKTSLFWIRKVMQIHNGRFDISIDNSDMKVLVRFPLEEKAKRSDDSENLLFKELEEHNQPILVFSNSEKLDDVCQKLEQKTSNIDLYHSPGKYIKLLDEGKTLEPNTIVLIDNELEEPWNAEKTMLRLKQQKLENVKFFAVVKKDCCRTNFLLETGFNACIKIDSCIKELASQLHG